MKPQFILPLAILFFVLSCKTNPFTGKKALNLYPNSQVFPMAFQQYDEFLKENKVLTNTDDAKAIPRVGKRIVAAAEKWFNANGYPDYLKDYQWEYNLVEDEQVNAWCMPGGKIVFYTGIMPITQNDTGIAVVMGHEIAHALANHGSQRMSLGTVQQLVGVAGQVALSDKDPKTQELFNVAYGVGSQVGVMLPFSRGHESEADEIGLKIMAIAGYNPDEAVKFWERMKAKSGGQAPPEFLSTHPNPDTRIADLKKSIAEAKKEAAKFGVTSFE